jgi:hypothetical protein
MFLSSLCFPCSFKYVDFYKSKTCRGHQIKFSVITCQHNNSLYYHLYFSYIINKYILFKSNGN